MDGTRKSKRPRYQYDKRAMDNAVQSVLGGGLTYGKAAKKYEVPKTTLFHAIQRARNPSRNCKTSTSSYSTTDAPSPTILSSGSINDQPETSSAIVGIYPLDNSHSMSINNEQHQSISPEMVSVQTQEGQSQYFGKHFITNAAQLHAPRTDTKASHCGLVTTGPPTPSMDTTLQTSAISIEQLQAVENCHNQCGGCGERPGISFCTQCNVTLCPICTKSHSTLIATKNHSLFYFSLLSRDAINQMQNQTLVLLPSLPCDTHPSLIVDAICRPCKQIICKTCRDQHCGHDTVGLYQDIEILCEMEQSLSSKFCEKEEKLRAASEMCQQNADACIKSKNDVKEFQKSMVEQINLHSDRVHEQLNRIAYQQNVHLGRIHILAEYAERNAYNMSVFEVSNLHTLLNKIMKGNQILSEIDKFMNISDSQSCNRLAECIMPNVGNEDYLKDLVKDVLKLNISCETKELPKDYTCLTLNAEITTDSKYTLQPCQQVHNQHRNDLVVFGRGTPFIRVYNADDFTRYTGFKCKVEVREIVALSHSKYVIKEWRTESLHLLDYSFRILDSMAKEDDYHNTLICQKSKRTLYKCDMQGYDPVDVRISIVEIINSKLEAKFKYKTILPEKPRFVSVNQSNNNIVFTSWGGTMYSLDMTDRNTQPKIDNRIKDTVKRGPRCMNIDAHGTILVGDQSGQIHQISDDLALNGKQLYIGMSVSGITVREGRLFVFCNTDDNSQCIKTFCSI